MASNLDICSGVSLNVVMHMALVSSYVNIPNHVA